MKDLEKLEEIKHIEIYKGNNSIILYNTRKDFDSGHTHIKSQKYAKEMAENITQKKRPDTHNLKLLNSYLRITKDKKYLKLIKELIRARRNGKPKYYR